MSGKKLTQEVFEDAPDWVNWAAIDEDGEIYFYENKPELMTNFWDCSSGFYEYYVDSSYDASDWKKSLIMRDSASKPEQTYTRYRIDVSDVDRIDFYEICHRFKLNDPSGALHHAAKKILLNGGRTGGKSEYDDIKEARDSLNRWLEINKK